MGIIRKDDAGTISRFDFSGKRVVAETEARPMVFPDFSPSPHDFSDSAGEEPGGPSQADEGDEAAEEEDRIGEHRAPMGNERLDGGGSPSLAPMPMHSMPPAPLMTMPPVAPIEPPPAPIFEVPQELVQSIYEDAVLRGLDDGKGQVMAELQVLQERYASALDMLDQVSRQLVDRNRLTLITLACKIAERLTRHHLSVHPEHLMKLVKEAIIELEEKDEVVVMCAAPDHAFLTSRRAELAHGMGDAFRIQVVADEALEYGDFRVETRGGSADGRVASRLAEVHDALLGLNSKET